MKYTNLAGYSTIEQYTTQKLKKVENIKSDFKDIFNLMFEEENNILFEENDGYHIKKTTYGESKARVDLIAKNIRKRISMIREDTSVAIYLDNGPSWIEAFWAVLRVGCRPLLLNMRLDDETLLYAMHITNTKLVISKDKIFPVLTMLESEMYNDIEAKLPTAFGKEMLVMSSGTSDNIKICAYSAHEIKAILYQSKDVIESSKLVQKHYEGELKLLAFLPFYHIFGFVAVYLWFGLFSRTFVKLNDLSPSTIQNTIKRHKVTHVFAVPLFWQKTYEAAIKEIKNRGEKTYKKFLKGMKLAQNPLIGKYITKHAFKEVREEIFGDSISFMITGGSMIDKKVLTFFNSIGYHLSNGYGMSEIGITSVELSEDPKILNTGTIGRPLHGVMYKIDENNELSVRSIGLAKYIFENGRVNKTEGLWFNTHDIVKKEEGRYFIYGRQDDLVISITGENLNPNIVEEKLLVDNIRGLCLINGRDNNMPVLLVSINKFLSIEKAKKVLDDIKIKLQENNLTSQIGRVELITEPFIKDDEFKMNRKKLENAYYEEQLSRYSFAIQEEDENDELILEIKKMFALALNKNVEDIHSDADFFLDEGGTSLDYFAIVSKIQEEFSINISSSGTPLNTVKSIANYIKENL